MNELILKASMTAEMKEYTEYVKKTQNILLKDLPYAPLVSLTNSMIAKPRVGGLDDIVLDYPYWTDWHVYALAFNVCLKK